MVSEDERDTILECFDKPTSEEIRGKAMLATYLATRHRFRQVLEFDLTRLDRVSGEILVRVEGGRQRVVRLASKALKLVKEYQKIRPIGVSGKLWRTAEGEPLSYWSGQSVFPSAKATQRDRKGPRASTSPHDSPAGA